MLLLLLLLMLLLLAFKHQLRRRWRDALRRTQRATGLALELVERYGNFAAWNLFLLLLL